MSDQCNHDYYITNMDGYNIHSSGEEGYIECETIEEARYIILLFKIYEYESMIKELEKEKDD